MLHPLLGSLFVMFEREGVRWCIFRGEDDLETPVGEIEFLIDRADMARAHQALAALKFVQLTAGLAGSRNTWLSYHVPTGRWIRLHILSELAYGPHYALQTQAEAGCLARRQRLGAIYVLAPEDAFWTLLLHCLLDKQVVALQDRVRLQELAVQARSDGQLAKVVEKACPTGWNAARLVACVRQSDWATLALFSPALSAAWRRLRPLSTWWRTSVHRAWQLMDKMSVPLRCRGLSVALLGPDGAGKSTLVTAIQNTFYFPTCTLYMGLSEERVPHVSRLRLPGLRAPIFLFTLWWHYLVAQYHRVLGRLVIFDRYTYDALLPAREQLTWLMRGSRWVRAHALPAPNLVLVLDVPGTVMYTRKGEHSPAHLESERQDFLALRHSVPQLQIVDGSRAVTDVCADVVNRIWQRQAALWRKNKV
jgi:thymidylate kinase